MYYNILEFINKDFTKLRVIKEYLAKPEAKSFLKDKELKYFRVECVETVLAEDFMNEI